MSHILHVVRSAGSSLVCALVGWATGVLLWGLAQLVLAVASHSSISDALSSLGVHSLLVAAFVLPIWLLVLFPLYCLVSQRSRLWHWPICTTLGAIAGAAILVLYFWVFDIADPIQLWFFPLEAAIVGASTCLFGALAMRSASTGSFSR